MSDKRLREALDELERAAHSRFCGYHDCDPCDCPASARAAVIREALAREQDAGEVVLVRGGMIYFAGDTQETFRITARTTPDGLYRLIPIHAAATVETCGTCGGSGKVEWDYPDPQHGMKMIGRGPCPDCGGDDG